MILIGLVQCVGFRGYSKRVAESLGVVGFVENREDGSVHIEAEGEESALKAFLVACRKGPSRARVEDVTFEFSLTLEHYSSFSELS